MSVSLCELHDVYVDGSECVVYVGDDVMVLSPIATSIVLQLQEGDRSPEQLAFALEEEFGAPPGTTTLEAVHGMLDQLVQSSVVQVSRSSA
jgi:hypothetical protein